MYYEVLRKLAHRNNYWSVYQPLHFMRLLSLIAGVCVCVCGVLLLLAV